jgi:hypothetical protein
MSALTATPVVSEKARALAARLAALFEHDRQLVLRLNDAQRRLRDANERLWSGLAPDAFGLIYDGAAPAGHSQIAQLIQDALSTGGPEAHAAWLRALQETHWQLHRAFCEHQSVCEQRRQLAVDVGELAVQLTDALCAAGWSEQDARAADVHQLAKATERTTRQEGPQR